MMASNELDKRRMMSQGPHLLNQSGIAACSYLMLHVCAFTSELNSEQAVVLAARERFDNFSDT